MRRVSSLFMRNYLVIYEYKEIFVLGESGTTIR